MRFRLCSTPARTFARVKTCGGRSPGGGLTGQPHFEARKNSERRFEMNSPM